MTVTATTAAEAKKQAAWWQARFSVVSVYLSTQTNKKKKPDKRTPIH